MPSWRAGPTPVPLSQSQRPRYLREREPLADHHLQTRPCKTPLIANAHAAQRRGGGSAGLAADWNWRREEAFIYFLADSPPRLLSYSPRARSCHPLLFSVRPSSLSVSPPGGEGGFRPPLAPGEETAIAAAGELPCPPLIPLPPLSRSHRASPLG